MRDEMARKQTYGDDAMFMNRADTIVRKNVIDDEKMKAMASGADQLREAEEARQALLKKKQEEKERAEKEA